MKENITINDYWVRFLTKDNEAFSCIYEAVVDDLFAYGMGMGYSSQLCEDAIQDTFYKIYTSKEKLKNIENFRFYLFRSFKNRLVDLVRQNKNIDISGDMKDPSFTINVTVLDDIVMLEEGIMLKKKVESLLKMLTDHQREAIYLRYMQDMTYEDIANLMKMNIESVRKLVYRSLEAIRKNIVEISTFSTISVLFSS